MKDIIDNILACVLTAVGVIILIPFTACSVALMFVSEIWRKINNE